MGTFMVNVTSAITQYSSTVYNIIGIAMVYQH